VEFGSTVKTVVQTIAAQIRSWHRRSCFQPSVNKVQLEIIMGLVSTLDSIMSRLKIDGCFLVTIITMLFGMEE
jgi:hypothetical protein